LNTTGVSPIVGGETYADSASFTLNTTGVSLVIGGASYADSANFTLLTVAADTLNTVVYDATGHYFQFSVTKEAGVNCVVQATVSLSPDVWINLVTNVAPFTFVDSSSGTVTQRYYRVMFLP
jgi:hypothetical protein